MNPAAHPQESARLSALRRYEILDTPREREFDDVVALAAAICGTPISTITLIDADRQWFKAEVGLGFSDRPRDASICAHVILENDFVEIPDTRADPRTQGNPGCLSEPGVRFYAGALLKSADGYPIGTLCVMDMRPRALTDLQRQALHVLAAQVVAQFDLRATLAREALLRREIDHRVKNSLQTVGAFVRLQRRATDHDDARGSLEAVERQIETVALLHDLLSGSGASDAVELADYLAQVVALLDASTPDDVRVEGAFAPLRAGASTAAAIGTVINELVANALKHSFASGASGAVTLRGEHRGDAYRITCEDNGRSDHARAARSANRREGLGLKIMAAAVRQLGGSLDGAPTANGFTSVLEFPALAAEAFA